MNNTIKPIDGSDFEVQSTESELNRLCNDWTAGNLNVDLKLFSGYTSQTCLSTS
jgi:hypothetical protein